jgi:hypothetical protein
VPDLATVLTRVLEGLVPLGPLELAGPVLLRRRLIAESDALLASALSGLPGPRGRAADD